MSELFEQLKAQQELRKKDYEAGWKAGYAQKEKELMEQAEQAEAEQRKYEEAEDYRQK